MIRATFAIWTEQVMKIPSTISIFHISTGLQEFRAMLIVLSDIHTQHLSSLRYYVATTGF